MGGDVTCNEVRHHCVGIAQDERIDMHRLERGDRIEHALALEARGQLHFDVDDVGTESVRGELEGHASAGRGFGEHDRHRLAVQRRVA